MAEEQPWRFALWNGEKIVPRQELATDIVDEYKQDLTTHEEQVVKNQKLKIHELKQKLKGAEEFLVYYENQVGKEVQALPPDAEMETMVLKILDQKLPFYEQQLVQLKAEDTNFTLRGNYLRPGVVSLLRMELCDLKDKKKTKKEEEGKAKSAV